MKTGITGPAILILLIPLLLLTLAGCGGTSSSGSGSGNGRSLSEIMTKKDAEEQEAARRRRDEETQTRTHSEPVVRNSGNERNTDYYDTYSDTDDSRATYEDVKATASLLSGVFNFFFSGEEEEEEGAANYRESGEKADDGNNLWFGYRYSWSHLAGDVIQGFRTGEVRMGLRKPSGTMAYIGISLGRGTLDRVDLEDDIDDLGEFGLTLGVTSFITPASSFMGLSYDVGLRLGETRWDFREPVPVSTDGGGEVLITEDSVFEGGPYLGLGLAIVRTEGFHLGAGALVGMRWRSGDTTEGFDNDLFQDVGYYQLNLEAVLHF